MTTDNIDTEALLKLQADACNLDNRSLMEVLLAQQKYERAIYAAAPALLAKVEAQRKEIERLDQLAYTANLDANSLQGDRDQLLRQNVKLTDERDALKAEVEGLRREIALKNEGYAVEHTKRVELAHEVERLRAALNSVRWEEACEYEGRLGASVYLSVDALNQIRAALRGEEAPRE